MAFLHTELCIHCLRVLSSTSRFLIFSFLKNKNQLVTISMLVKYLRLRQPTVTFHVNKLVESGLIKKTCVGRNTYCEIIKKCSACPLFA